jgi:hypothetical protein
MIVSPIYNVPPHRQLYVPLETRGYLPLLDF